MSKHKKSADHGGGGGGHDGGGSLRWLLTYADMITLLMAFFIMMYSMSVLNMAKFREAAISIRSGFGGVTSAEGRSILQSGGQFNIKPTPLSGDATGIDSRVVQRLSSVVKDQKLKDSVHIRPEERGLVVSMVTDKLLFRKGQADMTKEARKLLAGFAKVLKDLPNMVRIEGHTCNLPVKPGEPFPSNWELSTARATAVIRYLIQTEGLSPDRLSAVGYADRKPLVPNTNEGNRAMNRRVDIVILDTEYPEELQSVESNEQQVWQDANRGDNSDSAGAGTGGRSTGIHEDGQAFEAWKPEEGTEHH